MKAAFIFVLALCLSACSGSSVVEKLCSDLRDDYQSLQKQLPLQSDITTTLVGIEAFYLAGNNECYSTSTMNINVDSFISVIVKNEPDLNVEKIKAYFKSEEGIIQLKKVIQNKFDKKISSNEFPTNKKGFVFKEIYSFTGANIEKLTLEHKF